MMVVHVLSGLALLAAVLICLPTAAGIRRLLHLPDIPHDQHSSLPSVTVIVCALNEEAAIERTLDGLLAVHGLPVDIVAVDDRSTDATGAIIDRVAAKDPRVRVMHVRELPPGWYGKNHAMHVGAQDAKGEMLLFTDADIDFAPDSLARALALMRRERLDHLTALPRLRARSAALRMLMIGLFGCFFAVCQPWRIPTSHRHSAGVGAFNLVRREAYRRIGGHEPIRAAILDDLALGRLIKNHGMRQQLVFAGDLVRAEWYPDVAATWCGLQKNVFAFFGFRVTRVAWATSLTLVMRIWPWVGLLAGTPTDRLACVLALACQWALAREVARLHGWSLRCVALAPAMVTVECAIWWAGCVRFLRRRRIQWRGTSYHFTER